jgi:circadian clock protein KaiB
MTKKPTQTATEALIAASRDAKNQPYILKLYVAGLTPRSQEAIRNVAAICEEQLSGRCNLEVVDLYQNPVLAKGEQIIAAPTLIKKLPLPLRKIIGNMADKEKILVGLDLKQKIQENDTK